MFNFACRKRKRGGGLFIASLLAVVLLCASSVFAVATGVTYNTAVSCQEGPVGTGWVMYYGVTATTVAADSIGDNYTQAMWIPFYTESNAYWNMVMYNSATGTEDVDVYVEFSYDRSTWFVGSQASGKIKDQLTTTMVADTLNIQTGVADNYYKTAPWVRLHFDNQAGNPIGTYATWKLVFRKPTTLNIFPSYIIRNKI